MGRLEVAIETAVGSSLTPPGAMFLPGLGGPTLFVVLCAIGFICLLVCAIFYRAHRARKRRLDPRQQLVSEVQVSWRDATAERNLDSVRCHDFSAGGIGLELPEPIRIDTRVTVRVPSMDFKGIGSVRHCIRIESGYLVGIRFSRLTRVLAGLTSGSSKTRERC
jgi:hypothetical protein